MMPIAEGNHVFLTMLLQVHNYASANMAYMGTEAAGCNYRLVMDSAEGENPLGGIVLAVVNSTIRMGPIHSSPL